jgi:hypothetical protein
MGSRGKRYTNKKGGGGDGGGKGRKRRTNRSKVPQVATVRVCELQTQAPPETIKCRCAERALIFRVLLHAGFHQGVPRARAGRKGGLRLVRFASNVG